MSHKIRKWLEVECPRCGHVYEVTSQEIVRGAWRACLRCKTVPDEEPVDDVLDEAA